MVIDDSVLALIGFIAAFAALGVAALRFGVDSRRLTRERSLVEAPAVHVAHDVSRHRRVR